MVENIITRIQVKEYFYLFFRVIKNNIVQIRVLNTNKFHIIRSSYRLLIV